MVLTFNPFSDPFDLNYTPVFPVKLIVLKEAFSGLQGCIVTALVKLKIVNITCVGV